MLELAADGAAVEEIAQRAALSPGTVRNYLSSATTSLDIEPARGRPGGSYPRLDLSSLRPRASRSHRWRP